MREREPADLVHIDAEIAGREREPCALLAVESCLSTRIEARTQDETGQLMAALHDMNESLRGIVGNVRNGTESIAAASSQIASGNQDLSSRTEQTASELEQTASSLEQITATLGHSADHTRRAAALAQENANVAERGGQVINNAVVTMGEIRSASHRISDIIATIDGIAFQTNILALNAAVEAARAGDLAALRRHHGRILAISSALYAIGNRPSSLVRGIKAALALMRLCPDRMAEPFHAFTKEEAAELRSRMEGLGFPIRSA
jgi:methyl-accepting chemotaxis protein